MNDKLFKMMDDLRNQVAHDVGRIDSPAIAKRLEEIAVSIPPSELHLVIPKLLGVLGFHAGEYVVPHVVLQTVRELVEGHAAKVVCDPWAGLGQMASTIQEVTKAPKVLAFTPRVDAATFGRALVKQIEWQTGEPLSLLDQFNGQIDVAASVLPFGAKSGQPVTLTAASGEEVELRDDLGNLILAAVTRKLSKDGIGLFVVTPSFFFSQRSVRWQFEELGIGMEAALALQSGTFAPYTNMPAYLVVVRNRPSTRMFVGQLTSDTQNNLQVIQNLKQGKEGGTLDLGRFVDIASFTGIDAIRTAERFQEMSRRYLSAPAIQLEELATEINLGRPGDDFVFPTNENSVYVPLIGKSDVVDSQENLTLKPQNYAQLVIDRQRSDARFVARFLNSEFGRELREAYKSGMIPKLSKQTLKTLPVFVPAIQTQRQMLDVETRIVGESNTLLSLQNEIGELRRDLWSNPQSAASVNERIGVLSSRLSGSLKQHAAERLDQWFETLPFPLASILRAWQATSKHNYEKKCALLGKFFEATAEFVSVILLSAFSSNESLFEPHRLKLNEAMTKGKVSLKLASFGTWKVVIEYLGKQTRELLKDNPQKPDDSRANQEICAELFADPSLVLPLVVSRVELAQIISTTNGMRNNAPTSHGGTPTQEEARALNEALLSELQKLREVLADTWIGTQMIHALHSRMRRDQFENEISILMGSNNEFLTESRTMNVCMDVDRLYLSRKDSGRALKLLPLIQVGPSPQSVKNTCYFFNKVVPEGVRFVCYHHGDQSELKGQFNDAAEAIRFLTRE